MGYDRGDSFPFDFEPNGIPFGSNRKENDQETNMGYDRDYSFPFDFEPNEILFGSKLKGKLSPRSYPTQCERKLK